MNGYSAVRVLVDGSVMGRLGRSSSLSSNQIVDDSNRMIIDDGDYEEEEEGSEKCSEEADDLKRDLPKIFIKNLKSLQYEPKRRKIVNNIMKTLDITSSSGSVVVEKRGNISSILEENGDRKSNRMRKRALSVFVPETPAVKRRSLNTDNNSVITPGLLPTPKVAKPSGSDSAFVSKMCDGILSDIQTDVVCFPTSESELDAISRRINIIMPTSSTPPKIRTPLPRSEKPRTVAEKRAMLDQNPIEFRILDNESTVYYLIKKRGKEHSSSIFQNRVQMLYFQDVPVKRDVWRAMGWLSSEEGNHVDTVLTIDRDKVKLVGWRGEGTVDTKPVFTDWLYKKNNKVIKKCPRICDRTCLVPFIKNQKSIVEYLRPASAFESPPELVIEEKVEENKVVKDFKHIIEGLQLKSLPLKPGPLSAKIKQHRKLMQRDESQLGPLEIYPLPPYKIKVIPEMHKKQPKRICSYLKLALPDESLTTEWLKYSVSLVQAGETTTNENQANKKTHQFVVPYQNDQKNILVRRLNSQFVHRRNESYDDQFAIPLTFPDRVPRPQNDEDCKIRDEVETVLSEIIDSVALSYCEDSFIKDDPDLQYKFEPLPRLSTMPPMATLEDPQCVTMKRKGKSMKIFTELRRLNATIIDADEFPKLKPCTNEHCKFGCICESIESFATSSKHCMNEDCMFGCRCAESGTNSQLDNGPSLESEVLRIRDKKTCKMAKMEKEFRSTVVVTNTNTILMTDDAKRSRSKPKKFTDYLDSSRISNIGQEKTLIDENNSEERPAPRKRLRWLPELERMRHCTVPLPRIISLHNVQSWCMIHELYRCFCKNLGTDGVPFEVTGPGPQEGLKDDSFIQPARKRQYSFAKDENQDALEPIKKVFLLDEDSPTARLIPVVVEHHWTQNRQKARQLRFNLRFDKAKHERLEMLVAKCANFELVKQLNNHLKFRGVTIRTTPPPPRAISPVAGPSSDFQPLFTEDNNELGLKISSICTLPDSPEDNDPLEGTSAGAVQTSPQRSKPPELLLDDVPCTNPAVATLRKKLLQKIKELFTCLDVKNLKYPEMGQFMFFRMNSLVTLVNNLAVSVYEVYITSVRPIMVLVDSKTPIKKLFPKHIAVNILKHSVMTKTYVAKFITRGRPSVESNNVYAILLRTHEDYVEIKGCQYVPPIDKTVHINKEQLDKVEDFVRKCVRTKSNVKMYYVDNPKLKSLCLPLPRVPNMRWLMLRLREDFSDVSHPSWPGLLTYDCIRNALQLAKAEKKTVNLSNGAQKLNPNVYATPTLPNTIFVGPFDATEHSQVILYQRVDNDLLTREMYEQMTSIQRKQATIGFWLYVDKPPALLRQQPSDFSKPLLSNCRNDNAIPTGMRCDIKAIKEAVKETPSPSGKVVVQRVMPSPSNQQKVAAKPAETSPASKSKMSMERLPELQIIPLAQNEEAPPMEVTKTLSSPNLSIYSMSKEKSIPKSLPLQSTKPVQNIPEPVKAQDLISIAQATAPDQNRSVLKAPVRTYSLPKSTQLSLDPATIHHNPIPIIPQSQVQRINKIMAELSENASCQVRLGNTILIKKHQPQPGPPRLSVGSAKSEASSTVSTVSKIAPSVSDVIELSDDDYEDEGEEEEEEEEEERAEHQIDTEVIEDMDEPVVEPMEEPKPVEASPKLEKEVVPIRDPGIPLSGYYISNIKNLGNIPAKIFDGTVSLFLPIRKMPIKIGVGCVDRYMDRYIRNAVCTYLPRNLNVKWTFVNTYFPDNDEKFHLEGTENRKFRILTEYGVVDVNEEYTEEQIPDFAIYLKYLIFKLCATVFDALNPVTGLQIMKEAVKEITNLEAADTLLNSDKESLKSVNADLKLKLYVLQSNLSPVPSPSSSTVHIKDDED